MRLQYETTALQSKTYRHASKFQILFRPRGRPRGFNFCARHDENGEVGVSDLGGAIKCPLSRVKQTSLSQRKMSANDPKRTSGTNFQATSCPDLRWRLANSSCATSQDQLPRRVARIGALFGRQKKGSPMALDPSTFLIVLAAVIIVMAFVSGPCSRKFREPLAQSGHLGLCAAHVCF